MIESIISQRKLVPLYPIYLIIWLIFILLPTRILAQSEPSEQKVIFNTSTGTHTIILEVARTEQQKTSGLMYRKHLAKNAGMVFLYDTPTDVGIWMKNTYLPLDVIFIDCDNKVVDVVTRKPLTTDISYVPVKICSIIEVNAGLNKKIKLEKGNMVNFVPPIEYKL